MAVDDIISDYFTDITNGADLSIQPASGDEWLITHLLVEETGPWNVIPGDGGGYQDVGLYGGATVRQAIIGEYGVREVCFFLTNSEYILLHNASGGTDSAGYSGIKIKE